MKLYKLYENLWKIPVFCPCYNSHKAVGYSTDYAECTHLKENNKKNGKQF